MSTSLRSPVPPESHRPTHPGSLRSRLPALAQTSDLGVVVVIAALLLASAFALFSRGAPWAGEWAWTIDIAAGSTALTSPVVCAVAAWRAARVRTMAAVLDSTPRGWMTPLRAAAEAWVLGVVSLAICTATAVIVTLMGPHGGPVQIVSLAQAVAVLAVFSLAGAVAGSMLPSLVTVTLAAPVAFVVAGLGPAGLGPRFMRVVSSTGTLAGLEISALVVTFQVLALLGMCIIAGAVVLRSAGRMFRPGVVLLTASLGVLCVFGGLVPLAGDGDYRYELSGERADECVDKAPTVCAFPSHVRAADGVRSELGPMFAALREAGAELPARFEELSPGQEGRSPGANGALVDAGWLVVGLGPASPQITNTDLAAAASTASMPATCAFWFGQEPPPQAVYDATRGLANWLLAQTGHEPAPMTEGEARWLSGSHREQRTWVVATYRALKDCDATAVTVPWSG